MKSDVLLIKIEEYSAKKIAKLLPDELFNVPPKKLKILIKPNWIREDATKNKNGWTALITHPAVIEAIIIKLLTMLKEGSKITIADGPDNDADFEKILSRYPIKKWRENANKKGIKLEYRDLRDEKWKKMNGVVVKRTKLTGNPSFLFNLKGKLSEFYGHRKSKHGYYGADIDIEETNKFHDGKNNMYRLAKCALEADVFVNVPKLKTHRKGGITCSLKNLVGITTDRNFLPHHNEGTARDGGDQFSDNSIRAKSESNLLRLIKKISSKNTAMAIFYAFFKRIGENIFGKSSQIVRSGNWYGNDTVWRMILDVNKIFFYQKAGKISAKKSKGRKYISIVDAIICGESEGPLNPDAKELGLIIVGENPVAIDTVSAQLMGFDYQKIPQLKNAYKIRKLPLINKKASEISILLEEKRYLLKNLPASVCKKFKPHFGWKNHIEIKNVK